jgi:hypothetical protein
LKKTGFGNWLAGEAGLASRQEAAELIRQQQQGLGNPIVALKMNGQQIVAAGNTLYWSANWQTFADFLACYFSLPPTPPTAK